MTETTEEHEIPKVGQLWECKKDSSLWEASEPAGGRILLVGKKDIALILESEQSDERPRFDKRFTDWRIRLLLKEKIGWCYFAGLQEWHKYYHRVC